MPVKDKSQLSDDDPAKSVKAETASGSQPEKQLTRAQLEALRRKLQKKFH
jgi:hypothetical protein